MKAPLTALGITVIDENDDFLVLSKPAGVVVNRAQSVKVLTVQDWAEAYLESDPVFQKALAEDAAFRERSGMVHRLDKDTSGVLLWARNAASFEELLRLFRERQVQKQYVALVHGHMPSQEGLIQGAIERNRKQRDKFIVSADGRTSETKFRVREEFAGVDVERLRERWQAWKDAHLEEKIGFTNLQKELKLYEGGFSLVELQPKTGRTHQIRVHLDFLHHPIVGDARYTGRKKNRLDQLWCQRQWLHAEGISFVWKGKGRVYQAPVSEDLQESHTFLIGGRMAV